MAILNKKEKTVLIISLTIVLLILPIFLIFLDKIIEKRLFQPAIKVTSEVIQSLELNKTKLSNHFKNEIDNINQEKNSYDNVINEKCQEISKQIRVQLPKEFYFSLNCKVYIIENNNIYTSSSYSNFRKIDKSSIIFDEIKHQNLRLKEDQIKLSFKKDNFPNYKTNAEHSGKIEVYKKTSLTPETIWQFSFIIDKNKNNIY